MSNYMHRVAAFEPFSGASRGGKGAAFSDDDFSDEESPYNSSSTLLGSDDAPDTNWALSLARLREQRRRPFLGARIAMGFISALIFATAAVYGLAFYRQWAIAGAAQAPLAFTGLAISAAVIAFTTAHLWALSAFAADATATGTVRFTDFLQKLSLGAVLASAAVVLRLWQNDARVLGGDLQRAGVLRMLLFPTRAWALGVSAGLALMLLVFVLVGTSVPYRRPALVYAAGVRTFALSAVATSVAAATVALVAVLSAPARLSSDALLWGTVGAAAGAALLCTGLAVSATQAKRAAGVSKLWLLGQLAAAGGAGATGVLLLLRTAPGLVGAAVRSDSLFAVSILSLASAVAAVLAAVVLLVWKFNEYVGSGSAPKRSERDMALHGSAHGRIYY